MSTSQQFKLVNKSTSQQVKLVNKSTRFQIYQATNGALIPPVTTILGGWMDGWMDGWWAGSTKTNTNQPPVGLKMGLGLSLAI